jgi:PAS domain S-box-containing protein
MVLPLKYRIAGTFFLLETIVLAVVIATILTSYYYQIRHQLDREDDIIVQLLADFAREALLTREYELIQPHLEAISDSDHVLSIALYDEKARLVASHNVTISDEPNHTAKQTEDYYWKVKSITNNAGTYGRLAIQFSNIPLQSFHAGIRNRAILIAVIGLVIIAVLAIVAGHALTRRLARITNAANEFAKGRLDIKTQLMGADEVAHVGQAFDRMTDSIVLSQHKLREQADHIQLLMDSTAEAIFGIDTLGYCTFVNSSCLRILGYETASELIGKNMHKTIHHSHIDREHLSKSESNAYHEFYTRKGLHVDNEVFCRKGGSCFPAEYWSYPILKNDAVIGAVVTFIDITVRKNAEDALKKSEENWRSITENSPDHIMLLDLEGNIQFINRTVSGLSIAQVLNTPVYAYLPKEYRKPMKECLDKVRNTKKSDGFDAVYRDANGNQDHFESRVGPVFDANKVVGFTVSSRNVTARKQAEIELKKHQEKLEDLVAERTAELVSLNKELEAFSYSVSHDLRGPLRSIDGFSKLLLDDYNEALGETGQDYINRVCNACQRMGVLIDDLLALSKVSRYELQRSSLDLSDLVQQIVKDLKDTDSNRSVKLIIAPGMKVNADEHLVRIVMENLLTNAWKYTQNCPNAIIEFNSVAQNGNGTFFVRDNGVGFDMQYAANLFKPFHRLHSETEYPGSGIGLATVERIIKRHGGKVWAESEIGKGSTFYFTLENPS